MKIKKAATNTLYLNGNRRSLPNKQPWDYIHCYIPGSNKHLSMQATKLGKNGGSILSLFLKICYHLMKRFKNNGSTLNLKVQIQRKETKCVLFQNKKKTKSEFWLEKWNRRHFQLNLQSDQLLMKVGCLQ